MLSGVGQVLTATFTRFLLRKRLTNGQIGGIIFVGLGLAIRAAPASYFQPGSSALGSGGSSSGSASQTAAAGAGLAALPPEQLQGAGMVALAALLYSLLVSEVEDCCCDGWLQLLAPWCGAAHCSRCDGMHGRQASSCAGGLIPRCPNSPHPCMHHWIVHCGLAAGRFK